MDVRELILDEERLSGKAPVDEAPEGLSDPAVVWPEYEVVWRDGPDAVVCHRGDVGDELLVLLMSRGQFYLREPGACAVLPLTPTGLASFLEDAPGEGVDAVPWSSPLTPQPSSAAGFCSLVSDPTFSRLARRSMVWAEYGARGGAMASSSVAGCLRSGQKAVVRAAWGACESVLGPEVAPVALGMSCGLTMPWTTDGDVAVLAGVPGSGLVAFRDLFSSLERCVPLRDRIGLDVLRSYMSAWATIDSRPSWTFEAAALEDVLDLADREGIDFKPKALMEYATGEARRRCPDALDRSRWTAEWRDVLVMQLMTDGRVVDKYPESLARTREELMRRMYRNSNGLSADDGRLAERVRQLAPNEWVSGDYFIEVPMTAADIVDEGRQQHNCVGGYVSTFASGGTDLYFMRRCDDPDRSCVTVEVRNGEVRQAYGPHNRDMTQDERLWLESWGERCGIRVAASFMPQYAGDAPAAGNARHGNLVDARGPRLR